MDLKNFFNLFDNKNNKEEEDFKEVNNKLQSLNELNLFKLLMFCNYHYKAEDIMFNYIANNLRIKSKAEVDNGIKKIREIARQRKLKFLLEISESSEEIFLEEYYNQNLSFSLDNIITGLEEFLKEEEEKENYIACDTIWKVLNRVKREINSKELRGLEKFSL